MRYFKKIGPATAVELPDKRRIQFGTVDQLTGYRQTGDEAEAACYIRYMVEQRYGLSEITAQEYESEFAEKKRAGTALPGTIFRQERMGGKGLEQGALGVLGEDAVRAATALETATDIRTDGAVPPPPIVSAIPAPNLGKRPI
jgi:hypothetical protein